MWATPVALGPAALRLLRVRRFALSPALLDGASRPLCGLLAAWLQAPAAEAPLRLLPICPRQLANKSPRVCFRMPANVRVDNFHQSQCDQARDGFMTDAAREFAIVDGLSLLKHLERAFGAHIASGSHYSSPFLLRVWPEMTSYRRDAPSWPPRPRRKLTASACPHFSARSSGVQPLPSTGLILAL